MPAVFRWPCALLLCGAFFISESAAAEPMRDRRVAAVVTEYRHNSHADVIVSRLLLTHTLDGKGTNSPLKLVSLYTDQRPPNDISRLLAASHRFHVSDSIADALTLGTGKLAVEGILLVAEHGNYPKSPNGNTRYPKRRFWDEIVRVFRASGRVVPVFIDKQVADNWTDVKAILDDARELGIPLMAGSSVPGSWRRPAADVPRGAKVSEIVGITFGATDAYGFHGLEALQSLAEQRAGGETGVQSVQGFAGDAVWRALESGFVDRSLFDAARARLTDPRAPADNFRQVVSDPKLWHVEYADGLKMNLLELNGYAANWTAAWRVEGSARIDSTQFWTQEGRPAAHFNLLVQGVQELFATGRAPWNVERTVITSGLLDALLTSTMEGQRRIETPYLGAIRYEPTWRWIEPPSPPPMRPWSEQ